MTSTTKTVLKALQVLVFYLMLVNKLTGCTIRSLILEVNDHYVLSTFPSPHPPYGSTKKGEDRRRVWTLLQIQQTCYLPDHDSSMAKGATFQMGIDSYCKM